MIYLIQALPIFILSFIKAKYKISLKSRFFLYKNFYQKPADVHFHACSFGEVRSIENLVLEFDSRISVITQTGFDEAKKYVSKVNFLPFEIFLPFWFSPCKVLVICEAEYWLMLVFMAKLKGAKVLFINARISDKSLKKYQRFAFFYRKVFSYVDEVFAQSEQDKERLKTLGAKNIQVCKSTKSQLIIKVNKNYSKPQGKLIILASTHEKEEELLLSNLTLKEDERLIVAPRHPERFSEVEKIIHSFCAKNQCDMQKFSAMKDNVNFNEEFKAKVLLLDILGELINFYAISDIVVLCGSFVENIGGHNPIEPASFCNKIISGVFIHNQKSLYQEVENIEFCDDVRKIDEKIHLKDKISKLKNKKENYMILNSIKRGIDARKSL